MTIKTIFENMYETGHIDGCSVLLEHPNEGPELFALASGAHAQKFDRATASGVLQRVLRRVLTVNARQSNPLGVLIAAQHINSYLGNEWQMIQFDWAQSNWAYAQMFWEFSQLQHTPQPPFAKPCVTVIFGTTIFVIQNADVQECQPIVWEDHERGAGSYLQESPP